MIVTDNEWEMMRSKVIAKQQAIDALLTIAEHCVALYEWEHQTDNETYKAYKVTIAKIKKGITL